MSKKDYPELEGKEITYMADDKPTQAIVVGCNYDIGITIVSKEDKDCYLSCYIGRSAPNWVKDEEETYKQTWKPMFYSRVRQIKNGLVDPELANRILNAILKQSTSYGPRKEDCAFNQ